MPIDKMMTDPMLGNFRNMMQEVLDKGYTGNYVDAMQSALNSMEQYANELDDFNEFNAKLMNENLFGKFSDHYSRVLAGAAKEENEGKYDVYDDAADQALLKQALDALKTSISELEKSKEEAKNISENPSDVDVLVNNKSIIDAIKNLVELGESGVNYPTFLRIQTEKNLDKAMDGSAAVRQGLEYSLNMASALALNPHYPEKIKRQLAKFDEMATGAPFNSPDPLKFNLASDKIEWELRPDHNKWDKITDAFEELFDHLYNWALAHTSFAPHIDPWKMAENPQRAVERDKDCDPGMIKVREEIIQRNFDITFHEIFKHEVFIYMVKNNFIYYSQEMMEFLINEVYPQCKPCEHLSSDIVSKMEDLYKGKRIGNPEITAPRKKFAAMFNQYFGEGEYERRYPADDGEPSQATPWDLGSFKA